MSNIITLYDIPNTLPDKAWSPFVWRARLALSVKGLQYKTVWVEYPDIESICKKIGAKPTSIEAPCYTLPVIYDPSTNTVISNSIHIARYLDATYPSATSLFPPGSDALQEAFEIAYHHTLQSLRPIMLPLSCAKLAPVSEAYFRRTREAKFGKKLEEFAPPGPQRDNIWRQAQEAFGVVDSWLEKNGKEKKYVMGDVISYADITIAASLLWCKRVSGPHSQEWKDIEEWQGGRWAAFISNFTKYEETIL